MEINRREFIGAAAAGAILGTAESKIIASSAEPKIYPRYKQIAAPWIGTTIFIGSQHMEFENNIYKTHYRLMSRCLGTLDKVSPEWAAQAQTWDFLAKLEARGEWTWTNIEEHEGRLASLISWLRSFPEKKFDMAIYFAFEDFPFAVKFDAVKYATNIRVRDGIESIGKLCIECHAYDYRKLPRLDRDRRNA